MSIVRNRKLKKVGITCKSKKRVARKYIRAFVKCNRDYAYSNISCNMGLLPEFWKYGSVIESLVSKS